MAKTVLEPTTLLMCRLCASARSSINPRDRKQFAESLRFARSLFASRAKALAVASLEWPEADAADDVVSRAKALAVASLGVA